MAGSEWWRRYSFILWMAVAVAFAAAFPDVGAPEGLLKTDRWNWALVSALFLISGLLLPPESLGAAISRWRLHLFVQGVSLVLIPALFWLTAKLLGSAGMHPSLVLGLLFLGALSTTTTSAVVMVRSCGGDEAAAVFNAVLGSLLGVIVSPWIILITTGRSGSLPLLPVMSKLALQVILPLLIGQAIRVRAAGAVSRFRIQFSRISLTFLLVLVWIVMCAGFQRGFDASIAQISLVMISVIILHGVALGVAFHLSGWRGFGLNRANRTAAMICSTQKSAVLGLPLLLLVFGGENHLGLIVLPLLIYHPFQLIAASLLVPRLALWNQEMEPGKGYS